MSRDGIIRIPDPSPRGDTCLRAMVLAISAAEPVNVRSGGCVESVVTPRTHLRAQRFPEVKPSGPVSD
jgi:hypothetical protein